MKKPSRLFLPVVCLLAVSVGRPALAAKPQDPFEEAQAREDRGRHNGVYERYVDLLEENRLTPPARDWNFSKWMLLHAQYVLLDRAEISRESGARLKGYRGREFPTGFFTVFHEQLRRMFSGRLGLDARTADAIATIVERQAVELARVDYDEFAVSAGRKWDEGQLHSTVAGAFHALGRSSVIDPRFDVPFVAGYDLRDGSYVFIDQGVPEYFDGDGGRIPVWALLNVHERVEKGLLDEYRIQYQTAHQIALRVERATAEALGVDWEDYHRKMRRVIAKIAEKEPARVSKRLDFHPYYCYSDDESVELVRKMNAALVDDIPLRHR